MSAVNDGGPAFAALSSSPMGDVHHQPGMSLRDWFAGQALSGLLAYPEPADVPPHEIPGDFARSAYAFADGMLAERAKAVR